MCRRQVGTEDGLRRLARYAGPVVSQRPDASSGWSDERVRRGKCAAAGKRPIAPDFHRPLELNPGPHPVIWQGHSLCGSRRPDKCRHRIGPRSRPWYAMVLPLSHRWSRPRLILSQGFRVSAPPSPPPGAAEVSTVPATAPPTAVDQTGLPEEFVLTPEFIEEEAIRGDIVLRGAVILLATLFGWTHLTNTATLTQIRTGQELATHGFLPPRTDAFFSYTADDRPWINLSWLGDLLLAGLHALGGAGLLSIYSGLAAGAAFWLISRTSVNRAPTWWGSLCAGLAVIAVFPLLTAGPTLVTVVGLAATMYWLHRGAEHAASRAWWGVAATMLLWSNLDPRAYLGLLLVALYILGRWLMPPDSETASPSLRPLLAALVAGLVHPFALDVLRSPVTLIRQFHPLWLEYGGTSAREYPYLWRPVLDEATRAAPGWHLAAAGLLAVLSALSLVLNRKRLEWGETLAVLGLNVIGLAAGVDFTAIAVVNAVAANLNGQRWYMQACRLEYTLDGREILYSRGGRAVTVLALFAAAYWGVSGWMTGAEGRRIGLGFSHRLQSQIDGYTELLGQVGTDEFDDHPFHLTPAQGDLLVWLGRKSFTDSRLLLFAPREGVNLLEQQRAIASNLRSPSQPLTSTQAIALWSSKWQAPLDNYGVTHVVVPLDTDPGYALWVNLASQGMATESGEVVRFWAQRGISGPATVLYRLETPAGVDPDELQAFLREHGDGSVVQQTFRVDDDREPPRRGVFPRGPTFYETSLLLSEPVVSNDSLTARHYDTRLQAAQRSLFDTVAYAHQIIRHARRGLAADPNSAETYLRLGEAYQRLWESEGAAAGNRLAIDAAERRFLQAVMAYHHAAQCQPAIAETHARLWPAYLQHGDYDLALRHLDRVHALVGRYTLLPREHPEFAENHQATRRLRTQLFDQIEAAKREIEKARIGGLEATVRAALAAGCPAAALELLEQDLTLTVGNSELAPGYARLLLLSGRTLEGLEQFEQQLRAVEGTAADAVLGAALRPMTAIANLGADEYARAESHWERFARERIQTTVDAYCSSLPATAAPGAAGDAWPIMQVMTAAEALGRWIPDWQLAQWQLAMNELESGRNSAASRRLEQVLTSDPQSLLRPQIAMYLTLLTGQTVEPFLPAAAEAARPADRPPSPALPIRP